MRQRSRPGFDLVIIGLGSAGIVAADFARGLGLRTAAVEASRVGGDCLWTGCVPSKALIAAANTAHLMRTAKRFGIAGPKPEIDMAAVWARLASVQAEIAQTDDDPDRLRREGIEVMVGEPARVVGPHQVRVGERVLETRFILVCTGSRPAVPPIPGLEQAGYITSDTFFSLESPPASLIFLGGGPISLELAQAMRRLGTRVTVLEAADQVAGREEPELVSALVEVLRDEGVGIETGVRVESVREGPEGKIVTGAVAERRQSWVAQEIFLGTGRRPNVDQLGLAALGVELGPAGVVVDRGLRTRVRSIYACGDVTGRYLFTHSAASEGVQAVRDMFFPGRGRAPQLVPWCTFTDPQLAHAGLTIAEAKAAHRRVEVWRAPLSHSDRARADGAAAGEVVLITAQGRLVGAQILSPSAGEMIHELALAISQRLKLAAVYNLVHIYPTYSTEIARAAAAAGLQQARRLSWLVRRQG